MRVRAASLLYLRPRGTRSWRAAMRADLLVDARDVRDVPTLSADEHRQVRLALDPRAMAAYLQEAIGSPGWHSACYILDVKYEPGEYCTVLYRLGERLVVGTLRWAREASGAVAGQDVADVPATVRTISALGMQV